MAGESGPQAGEKPAAVGPLKRIAQAVANEKVAQVATTGERVSNTVRNFATAFVAVVTAAGLIAGYFGLQARPEATPSSAPAASDPLALSNVKRQLAFAIDPTNAADMGSAAEPRGNEGAIVDMKTSASGVELSVGRGGGYAVLPLKRTWPAKSVTEFDVAVTPGTDMVVLVGWRYDGRRNYQLAITTQQEFMNVALFDQSQQRPQTLTSTVIPLGGLQKGQVQHLALGISGSRFLVFVEGNLAADVTDTQIPVPETPVTSLTFGARGTKGAVTFRGIRAYAIEDPLPPPRK